MDEGSNCTAIPTAIAATKNAASRLQSSPRAKPVAAGRHNSGRVGSTEKQKIHHGSESSTTRTRTRLDTVDTFVDQDFDLDSTVLGPSSWSLIRCRCSVFAHGARRRDVPHRHLTFLHEISDDGFGSVLAEFRVHGSVPGRV